MNKCPDSCIQPLVLNDDFFVGQVPVAPIYCEPFPTPERLFKATERIICIATTQVYQQAFSLRRLQRLLARSLNDPAGHMLALSDFVNRTGVCVVRLSWFSSLKLAHGGRPYSSYCKGIP